MTNQNGKSSQQGVQPVVLPGQPIQQPAKVAQPGDLPEDQKPGQPTEQPDMNPKSGH